ncbi:lipid droplet-associated hydrolase [Sitophilus oryzae]|uniref:Lipid droplet-associated hydrolase n=1 Tax=Sitophilus oryzae TaxID=7048 RepID=A0A6J2XHN0_SITOR|nr:lipid droplet-associated hydrolase [Sitophilus oryzae]XP_030750952.1 lipid droplet-associated hydrolase [Sitophilus oryzae]XP_030750953.1 lipid droplet-associated hydrolase [Sitophilus oryzae]
MNEAFVEINKVRTKVVTWGRWIEEAQKDTNKIIIFIPGNPGVVSFYNKFAQTLYERSEIPVWCVGHAGHNFADKSITTFPKFEDHKSLYGLKGQVEHKVEFFKKYVPQDAKIYLVAHSIGSYVSLELLEHPDIKNRIENVYLLFPTVEHMANTKNGKFLNFVKCFVSILLFLSWIFTLLPTMLSALLLYIYTYIANVPYNLHSESIKELLKPGILRRVFFLAYEEMDQVKERNSAAIRENVNKIKFYYGKTDGWTPDSYINKLKQDIPNVDVEICTFDHAFVFNYSTEVGATVADWILTKK